MTQERRRRVIHAMTETQEMLNKLEHGYAIRPEHLQTDEDRDLIAFYHRHVTKLAGMLAEKAA